MKEIIKLNDKIFKEIFTKSLHYWYHAKETQNFLINICEKKEITNNDILRFYFECCKLCYIDEVIAETIFDYKMLQVESFKIIRFVEIVKKTCPKIELSERISYHDLHDKILFFGTHSFDKLVNIFLDEI